LRSENPPFNTPTMGHNPVQPSFLDEALLLSVRRTIIFGNDTVWSGLPDEQKLLAYIEINADAWARAWAELREMARSNIACLGAHLGSNNVDIRRVAARTLRSVGGHESLAALSQALYDSDVFVRDEAVLALALADDLELATSFIV